MSDVFREVDEEFRQEQLKALWKRYGTLIVVVVVVVVLGVGGWQAWLGLRHSNRIEASDRFAAAIEQVRRGDIEGGLTSLGEQSDPAEGGFGTLAAFAEARVLAGEGKTAEAVAIWDALAASSASGRTFRAMALLLSVMHQADDGDPAALSARLDGLTAAGDPFRPTALELQAVLALKAGDSTRAAALLDEVAKDPASPPGLQARAVQLRQAIGGAR